jgi:CRISPR-associated exonuclease Cas4
MDDYLSLSYLNQYAYCPRRFWLIHVQGEMQVNAAVLEGTLQHERVHFGDSQSTKGVMVRRHVAVFSHRLQLTGIADLLEIKDRRLIPVEYKHGGRGNWHNDQIQLCAQALCLEEMLGMGLPLPVWAQDLCEEALPIPFGEIYYWKERRRQQVLFTVELRTQTILIVQQIQALLAKGTLPPPEQPAAKCRGCSLVDVCLPKEIQQLSKRI